MLDERVTINVIKHFIKRLTRVGEESMSQFHEFANT